MIVGRAAARQGAAARKHDAMKRQRAVQIELQKQQVNKWFEQLSHYLQCRSYTPPTLYILLMHVKCSLH